MYIVTKIWWELNNVCSLLYFNKILTNIWDRKCVQIIMMICVVYLYKNPLYPAIVKVAFNFLRRLFTAAYRSLSPQNVMTRKSWDRLPVVNKSDIYSWSPCKGKEFHCIYFSIMTIWQCDSVAKAFSLMPVSFYIEIYLLIFLKTICAGSWQRKSAKI